jgi:hypothetical protein
MNVCSKSVLVLTCTVLIGCNSDEPRVANECAIVRLRLLALSWPILLWQQFFACSSIP